MSEDTSTLTSVFKGWDTYQDLLIQTIAPLSAEQLALRAAPHLNSIGILAAHIVGARARWIYEVMGEGKAELPALTSWGRPGTPTQNTAELINGLETSWQVIQNMLGRWTLADLSYTFEGVRYGEPYALTRQWIIWHLIEHDLNHGGEISLTLGMHGLTGLDL